MMHARPKNFFSPDVVVEEDDQKVALLDLSSWREGGTFEHDGTTFTLSREGLIRGTFELKGQGRTLARATRPSIWKSTFELHIDGRSYRLHPRHVLSRTFDLDAGGRRIGSIRARGAMGLSADADLPREWALPVRLFVLWLVLLLWRRASNAA